ncbi:MAG: hypothetical protein H7Y43_13790 [Akkermansiaceae bacterium]|nr:hypothetical protein [Verrucomicrobiales bacterium]
MTILVVGLALALGIYLWWQAGIVPRVKTLPLTNGPASETPRQTSNRAANEPGQTSGLPSAQSVAQTRAVAPRPVAPATPTLPELTNIPPATVLENLRHAFRQYAARFGGNPVGTNPEITSLLNGRNPRQVQFLNPEDGLRVNETGELVDNWGTPFFFHQLSAKEMEVHSAGPDRILWTADDLVVK